ncbi:putative virion structural protein [Pseudomonas phage OBP]|uniref:virion structural protein n=1 Tax=Pseudomonas phage OBP TaxID=1124849 RepID=UPI000240D602|nr:virion structural protein [Pseudomonas phage OBP]AEV89719.1 putative virion structural protein [Pseudomonas phage OBP]
MEIEKLTKDLGRVEAALKVLPDGSVVALQRLKACFPKRFEQSNLADIGDTVQTILMVGVIVGDYYAFFGGMTKVVMKPGDIYEATLGNDRYFVLDFEPGDVVIEALTVPMDANIGYYYYLEFTKYARLPWYLTHEDLLGVYDEAKFYTGKSMGTSNQAIRVLYALTCRDPKNLDIPFRYGSSINDPSVKPKIIGINNPGQLLNSTFSRLASGYMSDNIISGILNPDTKVTNLEEVIRGLPSRGNS